MSDTMGRRDHARILLPPPIIYFGTLLVTVGLERLLFDRSLLAVSSQMRSFGGGLAVGGLVLVIIAIVHLLRARTAVNPYHSTTNIVSHGVFMKSRNPIYLGFTFLYIGIALVAASLLALLTTPLVLLFMQVAVIRREEAYLEEKFGEEYRAYRARVRRWM